MSRLVAGAALVGLPLASLSLVSCDKLGLPSTPGGAMEAAADCPDLSSVSAVLKIDWAKEFGIDVEAAARVRAGVQASLELRNLAATVDAKLVTACGGLARDLGAGGNFKTGEEACKAASKAMADIKAKMGGNLKISLAVQPPHCRASIDAMADCVAECDASVEPGSVEVTCEKGKLSGTCEAECTGRCDLSAAAKCEGTCQGSCNASFTGSCGGECSGKCDGQAMQGGSCAGRCEGTCSANAEGSCGGQCSGSCEMSASGQCSGTCTGECSVEMKAPSCEGEITPPKASAECNAACEARVDAEIECVPAQVSINVDGAADVKAAATYAAAIRKHLPLLLEVAIGMKEPAMSASAHVEAVVGGAKATIRSLDVPSAGARLSACVAAPFQAAFDAAASLKANVSVSVEVQASVSASASGSASGSAG